MPGSASLSPALLAVKGAARPAMRVGDGAALGWDDRGAGERLLELRLDAGRLGRLRRASAAAGCSAEQLATNAIDHFLTSLLPGETAS